MSRLLPSHRLLGLFSAALLSLLALPSALALPSQVGQTFDGAVGTAAGLAVSDDGMLVALAGSVGLSITDLRVPGEGGQISSSCADTGARDVVFVDSAIYGERFYVVCSAGGVEYVDLDRSTYPVGLSSSEKITVGSDGGSPSFLVSAPGDSAVFVVSQEDGVYSIHSVGHSLTGGEAEALLLEFSGTAVAASVSGTGTPLMVARSDGFLTELERSGDTYIGSTTVPFTPLGTLEAVLSSANFASSFVADFSGNEVWQILQGSTSAVPFGPDFIAPMDLAEVIDDAVPVLWVGEQDGRVSAWDSSQELLVDLDSGVAGLSHLAASMDEPDTLVLADSSGGLTVLHDRPSLSSISVTPTTVLEGESFVLSFSADLGGSWDARVGGDHQLGSGSSLGTGTLEAEVAASIELLAEDLPSEGDNRIFVFLDDGEAVGWDSVVVTLDTPPDGIGTPTLGRGDEKLYLTWVNSEETDIASYDLFVSESEFDAESLPNFTLEGDGGEVTEFPLSIDAGLPGVEQTYELEGLTNGTTYFLALRPVDEGGLVGPLSDLVSGAPERTCGAAECANDPGCSCGYIQLEPASGFGLGLAFLVVFGLARSRRAA